MQQKMTQKKITIWRAQYKVTLTEKMMKEYDRLAESYYLPIPRKRSQCCKAKPIANTAPKLIVHQILY